MNSVQPELSLEEIAELEQAEKKGISYDEDCPEMTETQLREFHSFDEIPVKISKVI
jgi:hypothetical protein